MKKQLVMLLWIFILAVAAWSMFGCKESDYVITTPDGWRLHSIVPVDSSLQ